MVVLRFDDRGVGGSTGDPDATPAERVSDVDAALRFLMARAETDPKRVGLIGHSEGGSIAASVAADEPAAAFIVSLAGSIVPGRELLPMQAGAIARSAGANDDVVATVVADNRRLITLIAEGADVAAIAQAIRASIDTAVKAGTAHAEGTPAQREQFVQQQIAMASSRWFKHFVAWDPSDAWQRVRCPVLAMNGKLDVQVPHQANLAALKHALTKGGHTDHELVTLPDLNHLFQTATTGAIEAYATIEETIAPVALDALTRWLRARKFADPTHDQTPKESP